ncbi:MAG: twin-arginine translocase TatA/TatE family subunit [Chloroflexota bacterium]
MSDLLLVLIVVLIIVVILRGPKTFPEIGRMFGRGVREARIEAAKIRSTDETPKDGTDSGA